VSYRSKSTNLKSKAQVSVEYLIIIGISFAILIPGGYFFYNYSKSSNDATIRTQITQMGTAIITSAESIYGLSDGSLVTLDLRYPKNVRDVYVLGGNELIIKYELSSGMNDAVFFSKVALSGNFTYPRPISGDINCSLPCDDSAITANLPQQGAHKLKFESKTRYVFISQAK
jgi:uncharacterized protein (UPF0333 family)